MSDIVKEIEYPCKADSSMQKALAIFADGDEPRPLVVALHTWSHGYKTFNKLYADECAFRNWHMIHPDFRGPNWLPDGCGSDLVVSDIEDAVAYMRRSANVDGARIYLMGGSGGGHCALLLAGRRPELWTAVSAWCPISDIGKWHEQCLGTRHEAYAAHIESACGGNPQTSDTAAGEAVKRSPLTWLGNAESLPIDINTGIHDGHTGSVPVSQALDAYNTLAAPVDRIGREDIEYMVKTEKVPSHLLNPAGDPSYADRTVYMRRQSQNVRITLFEGGHDIIPATGFLWLERQVRHRKPDWSNGAAPATVFAAAELTK